MTRTAFAKTTAMLAATAAVGPVPAALAQSPSGGAAAGDPSSSSSGSQQAAPPAAPTAPAEPAVVVAGGAVTLRVQGSGLLGHTLAFSGAVPRRDARRTVVIQRFDGTRGGWVVAAATTAGSDGAFATSWRANLAGQIPFRAVAVNAAAASRRTRSTGAPDTSGSAHALVYRPSVASFFGPGFYGQQTACGETMTRDLVGVANRTLPCGTLVQFSYAGRRLTVPVVDRGPYANGADWDLTSAAAQELGVAETVHIGALVTGRTATPPAPSSTSTSSPSSSSPGATGGASA